MIQIGKIVVLGVAITLFFGALAAVLAASGTVAVATIGTVFFLRRIGLQQQLALRPSYRRAF